MRDYKYKFYFLLAMLLTICSGKIISVENPIYSVDRKADKYEIRIYQPTIVAEVVITSSFEDAGNQAFRILADYIFGNNNTKTKMEMTAPVTMQIHFEEIASLDSISKSKNSEFSYLTQFFLQRDIPLNLVPEPVDKRIRIDELPQKKFAVLTYSGSWSEENYKEHLSILKEELKRNGELYRAKQPIFARYNSPFQLWFLRKNEIWIEVE